MKRLLVISLLAGLLWPSAASAWEKSCSGTDITTMALSPGDYACWTFTSTGDVSGYLSVHQCENIDIVFNSDLAATTSDSTVQIWNCFDYPATASTSNCNIAENLTLDGVTSTGLDAIFGYAAVWIVADAIGYGATDDQELIIKCNGPQGY